MFENILFINEIIFITNRLKLIIILIIIYIYINRISRNEKISIIIPTYNRGYSILKSIKSVLNQTYKNFEILIIDDGSNDNTKDLILNLDDSRIKYIKLKNNKGASFARNIGIQKASGKYISFLDSDDIYRQDKLEKQYTNLIMNNADFDFCKVCVYINETNFVIFPNIIQEININKSGFIDELCIHGNFISTQAILVKKSYIKKYLFDNKFPRLQDYDLVLRMVPNLKVSYTKQILVDLKRNNDSIGNSDEKYIESLKLILNKDYHIKCNFTFPYKKLSVLSKQ